ncbi:hypothetical protein K2173_018236 [Erythroxylum novogranatense]|uniref:Cullin family profile domain-containing protein n=1 Tax=Erythroxylum novogranatense TaxID=1862640 RepID=A0AAV8TNB3_9ROSI|nr:hypothetical protein K2173_018236 [Erythroxylum novogranatense]
MVPEPTELDKNWNYVQEGIHKLTRILDGKPEQFTTEHYIMLYTTVYNLCTHKSFNEYSMRLYDKFKESFEVYIDSTVLSSLIDKQEEFMLRELAKRWNNHKIMVRWMSRFFNYLDRYFVTKNSLPTLNDAGLTCFRDLVYRQVCGKATDAVLLLINKEREGEQIDRALLKNVLGLFVDMGIGEIDFYIEDFEGRMIDDTGAYYSRKASKWILNYSCPQYMIKAEECLKKETDRVLHYLHTDTEPKLIEKVQHELLVVYANQLFEMEHSGCRALLRDEKVEDLSRIYRLFLNIPQGLEPVATAFKQYITAEGKLLVQQAEDAASNQTANGGAQEQVLIRKIMELHDKYEAYVNDCFQNHTLFHKGMKEAFEVFCNKTVAGCSGAEILATFCDNTLKKGGSEKLSDEAIEETLEKIVKLLEYISDKDLFAEFHRKKLARRLIFERSAGEDYERNILTKLKQLYGGQFTSKMEGMVTDITLAEDNQNSFEEYLGSNPQIKCGFDMTVNVLTTGFWPTYKSSDLILPLEMARGVEVFKSFYNRKANSRKLTWIFSLGTCHLNGRFEQKTIELVVSTYQAAILMLFNEADRLNYADIIAQTNFTDGDLVRLLQSLSCAKYKILNKETNTKTVSRTENFEFNHKFTDRLRRIKIPLPPVDEGKKIIEDVNKGRGFAVDAAIVRIMKSRKVLNHQQLTLETVAQLRHMFKPDVKVIKKRIEDLITRDYLERDEDDPNVFRYLA